MGPLGTGAAGAGGVFPEQGRIKLTLRWVLPLGRGYSSISVAGGRAYTLADDGEDVLLVAIDAADGRQLWSHPLDATGRDAPSSTPAIAGDRVFALSPQGMLHAIDAATGEPLWSHDLREAYDAAPISYGMSTSPLVVDDLVVVLVGGREAHNLVAFDAASGGAVWSASPARQGSYASPTLLEIDGVRQIVVPADDLLYAVRPEDGRLLWSRDGLGSFDRLPLPLPGERLFLAREANAIMLRLSRSGEAPGGETSGGETSGGEAWTIEELWRTDALRHSYSPAVHLDGSLYGFDNRELTCLDASTGEIRWRQSVGTGSHILVDGHLVVLDADSGMLRIVTASPRGHEERAAIRALEVGHGAFGPPSFAGRTTFLRNHGKAVAVEVGE